MTVTVRRMAQIACSALAALGALAVPAWACPMCKIIVQDAASPEQLTRWGQAFSAGVLAMVSMPFLLVGVIGWQIARATKTTTTPKPTETPN